MPIATHLGGTPLMGAPIGIDDDIVASRGRQFDRHACFLFLWPIQAWRRDRAADSLHLHRNGEATAEMDVHDVVAAQRRAHVTDKSVVLGLPAFVHPPSDIYGRLIRLGRPSPDYQISHDRLFNAG